MKVKARDLQSGDMVDMEVTQFPFKYADALAEYELGEVDEVDHETPTCFVVYFTNLTAVAVDPDQVFQVEKREMQSCANPK